MLSFSERNAYLPGAGDRLALDQPALESPLACTSIEREHPLR
jgi:hypothetical protein